MKRLIFTLSLALFLSLFVFYRPDTNAYQLNNYGDQAQIAGQVSYRLIDWEEHREHEWREHHDFDRPYYGYGPYYDYGPYEYGPPDTYYYGPGFSVNTPLFGINIH